VANKKTVGNQSHRLTVRLSEEDFNRLEYWSNYAGVSINEFIPEILDRWVNIENGNYQLPTLEAARLNQLVDVVTGLSNNVQSLESITINGFDGLLKLTKGDNYLLEHDDGEF
jgi:hypothetical protein